MSRLFLFIFTISSAMMVRAQQADTLTVHFDFNKSDLTPLAIQLLDSLLNHEDSNRIRMIDLYGHCDFIGNDHYNDSLSVKRVQTVRDYLVQHNIDASTIGQTIGKGKRAPLSKKKTDVARAMNRRVELYVLRTAGTAPADETNTLSLREKIRDTATREGSNIILQRLNFLPGRHVLRESSLPILEELLQVMNDNPTLAIEIQGHICCGQNGDGVDIDLGTLDLSVQRAKAVFEYLIENGIARNRLAYKGFGSAQKLYPEETNETERNANRRVEIRIIRK